MARRITKDYDTELKDDLLAEAQARNLPGINTTSSKADIVAALEDNDTAPAQPKPPLPPLKASPIPQLPAEPEIKSDLMDTPKDEDYTDGIYVSDGEQFAVCIVKDHPSGRTHFAKNSRHFWNGTEAEFKAKFDKK